VTGGLAIDDLRGSLGDGNPVFDMLCGGAALSTAPSAFGFGAWKKMAPVIVLGAPDLAIDKAIDTLMTEGLGVGLQL